LAPPAVLLDGALGKDLASGAVFHRAAFTVADAGAVLDAFEQAGLSPCVYVERPDVDVVVGDAPSTHPAHLDAIGRWLARGDLRAVVDGEPVLSFCIAGRDDPRFAAVAATVTGVAEVVVTRDLSYGASALTVRPRGVTKWRGVEAYCRWTGLDASRVLAVGDGDNDLELLAGARVACVVSDGCEAALSLADHVIEPAAEGGWCAVLDLC
ncbi:MAG: HAD hydrolase family protein, partial [Actinomycetota bacterium]|nr:HAD hydrolase family protein [Actinomycetota bacterium]